MGDAKVQSIKLLADTMWCLLKKLQKTNNSLQALWSVGSHRLVPPSEFNHIHTTKVYIRYQEGSKNELRSKDIVLPGAG